MKTHGFGAWQSDFRDTIPTEPAEFSKLIRHLECCGNCKQGREACPTPQACEVPEGSGALLWPLAVALVLAIAFFTIMVTA